MKTTRLYQMRVTVTSSNPPALNQSPFYLNSNTPGTMLFRSYHIFTVLIPLRSSYSLESIHASYCPSQHTNFTKLKLIKIITDPAIIMSKTYMLCLIISLLNACLLISNRHFILTYSPFRGMYFFSSYFFRGLL